MLVLNIAYADTNWTEWVLTLKKQVVTLGMDPVLFDSIFKTIKEPDPQILHLDRTQPEHRITFLQYRDTRADKYKIYLGRKEYRKNHDLLENIADHYHVDPCFIVALWGMETSYGRYMGNFPVIQSLATLAYNSRRSTKFYNELIYALQMINAKQVSLDEFKGEWAGASGHPQFLPSSWFQYAEDFDQDGRKNIWSSIPDALASIANYLAKNNWINAEPFLLTVLLPDNFDISELGMSVVKPIRYWNEKGIRTINGELLPYEDLNASIIQYEGGPTIVAYPNFKVILSYNNSNFYAGTIGYMANEICTKK